MPAKVKYVTGNKAADAEIAYLQKTFPNMVLKLYQGKQNEVVHLLVQQTKHN